MIDVLSHDFDVIYCLWYYWSYRCIYSMCANGIIDDSLTAFILGVDNLQTTSLGEKRIIRNLRLSPWQDAVSFCREVLFSPNSRIYRSGKNWYGEYGDIRITVNAGSFTIITAHMIKKKTTSS